MLLILRHSLQTMGGDFTGKSQNSSKGIYALAGDCNCQMYIYIVGCYFYPCSLWY